jgi:hypothetical protein
LTIFQLGEKLSVMIARPSYRYTWQELSAEKAMVFMAGPRQSGKTTLAQMIADEHANRLYFNWDIPTDRIRLIEQPFFFEALERRDRSKPIVVFDEIHKYRDWKNYLKGVYDRFHEEFSFLVSGSGRLDIYQKGGDSLAGRYYLFHLWPFTLAELAGTERCLSDFRNDPLELSGQTKSEYQDIWNRLEKFSGFPEPYMTAQEPSYLRWSTSFSHQLIREDIRDLTGIKSLGDLETLYYMLPSKVGSPLSIPSLSSDLKTAYNTIAGWLETFERFFLIISLTPWTRNIARAIQKERKIYLWDSPRVRDPAARLENMVALELYRAVTLWNDLGRGRFRLHFIKNKDQQEVDFLIAEDNRPLILIEVKLLETQPSKALLKFQSALQIPAVQLTNRQGGFRVISNADQRVLVAPAWQWIASLPQQ